MLSFSGIDCAGKSTQIDKIVESYTKKGIKCKKIWSRGGYTPLLEAFKSLVRSDKGSDAKGHEAYREKVHGSSRKRKLLLWLSILDLVFYYGIYFRFMEIGKLIIADRYIWDSYIDFKLKYPEYDFESWFVWKALKAVHLKPKVSVIYTIPAEESMRRSELKAEPFPEPIDVRETRIAAYMVEIEYRRWQHVIDATKSIDEVFRQTMRAINHENI